MNYALTLVLAILGVVAMVPVIIFGAKKLAVLLLISGALLGSTIQIGEFTLDNILTILGAAIATISLALKRDTFKGWNRLVLFPIALIALIAISGILNSVHFLPAAFRFFSIGLLVLLVSRDSEKAFSLTVLRIIAFMGAISVLLAPFTDFFGTVVKEDGELLRAGGLMGHPNYAAYALSLVVLYLLLNKKLTIYIFVEIAVLIVAILSTGSLGAILTLGCVWGLSLLSFKKVASWIVAIFALFSLLFISSPFLERLNQAKDESGVDSLSWRFRYWQRLIESSADMRIFGAGWGQTAQVGNGIHVAHSAYVQTLVELGIFGIVVLLIVSIYVFSKPELTSVDRLLVAYVLVTSLTDRVLFYPSTLLILLLLLSMRGHNQFNVASTPKNSSILDRSFGSQHHTYRVRK